MVTGICFLLSMVVAPLVTLVPYEAATPALILVGFLMMTQVKGIDFDDLEVAFPAFLTIILMPFTYSISAGIGAGFVTYVLLKLVRGKARQIHPLMWVVSRAVRRLLRHRPARRLAHLGTWVRSWRYSARAVNRSRSSALMVSRNSSRYDESVSSAIE